MKPANQNFTAYQAATFHVPLQWKSGGVPVDLTGYSFRMWVKAKITDAQPLSELTSENGGILVLNAAEGRLAINAESEQTMLWVNKQCVYDLVADAPNGDCYRLMEGVILTAPAVTLPRPPAL